MKNKKLFLKIYSKIRIITFVIFFISAYSGLSYSSRDCQSKSKSDLYCSTINKLTFPGRLFNSGMKNTLVFIEFLKGYHPLSVSNVEFTKERFQKIPHGFSFNYEKGSRPNAGFLILSKANPSNKGKSSIEIWDLNKQKLIHDYKFDGIPWSNPYIWYSNIICIIILFLYRRKTKLNLKHE